MINSLLINYSSIDCWKCWLSSSFKSGLERKCLQNTVKWNASGSLCDPLFGPVNCGHSQRSKLIPPNLTGCDVKGMQSQPAPTPILGSTNSAATKRFSSSTASKQQKRSWSPLNTHLRVKYFQDIDNSKLRPFLTMTLLRLRCRSDLKLFKLWHWLQMYGNGLYQNPKVTIVVYL